MKKNRGGIFHAIHQYAKANNKYMKDYAKNKESSYLKYWDINNLYGWAMWQKLPVNKFEWIEDTAQFKEDFMKNYAEESDERCFYEIYVQYTDKLHQLQNDLSLSPGRMKTEKVKKLVRWWCFTILFYIIYMAKLDMSFT